MYENSWFENQQLGTAHCLTITTFCQLSVLVTPTVSLYDNCVKDILRFVVKIIFHFIFLVVFNIVRSEITMLEICDIFNCESALCKT